MQKRVGSKCKGMRWRLSADQSGLRAWARHSGIGNDPLNSKGFADPLEQRRVDKLFSNSYICGWEPFMFCTNSHERSFLVTSVRSMTVEVLPQPSSISVAWVSVAWVLWMEMLLSSTFLDQTKDYSSLTRIIIKLSVDALVTQCIGTKLFVWTDISFDLSFYEYHLSAVSLQAHE